MKNKIILHSRSKQYLLENMQMWTVGESNSWPQQCECCALPAELTAQVKYK